MQALCAAVSATGSAAAFGDAGGYVHLWGSSEAPQCCQYPQPTQLPSEQPQLSNEYDESEARRAKRCFNRVLNRGFKPGV